MGTPPAAQTPPGQPPAGYGYPPQQGYPAQQPPAGYGQPPPTWGGSAPPAAWNPGPGMGARPMNWEMFSFVFRMLGFVLLALGALIAVAFVSAPGSCFTSGSTCFSSTGSFLQGAANGILVGKILFVLGALILGLGAGMKLHWVLRAPTGPMSAEQAAWMLLDRIFNYALVGLAIVLIFLALSGASVLPSCSFSTGAGGAVSGGCTGLT